MSKASLPPDPGKPVEVRPPDDTGVRLARSQTDEARTKYYSAFGDGRFSPETRRAEDAMLSASTRLNEENFRFGQESAEAARLKELNEKIKSADTDRNGVPDLNEIKAAENRRLFDTGLAIGGAMVGARLTGNLLTDIQMDFGRAQEPRRDGLVVIVPGVTPPFNSQALGREKVEQALGMSKPGYADVIGQAAPGIAAARIDTPAKEAPTVTPPPTTTGGRSDVIDNVAPKLAATPAVRPKTPLPSMDLALNGMANGPKPPSWVTDRSN